MRKIYQLIIFCFISIVAIAENADSTKTQFGFETNSDIIENLDSLVNDWYLRSYAFEGDSIDWYETDSLVITGQELDDSLIIDRLGKIPAIFDLSYNDFVRNYINVYTGKKNAQVKRMLALSEYYFPMIEEALDLYELPMELKYLTIIESALNIRARSRAGAAGLWQFMYRTGKSYGLEINSYVDERYDPYKSTYAAMKFLKNLYSIYGDWTLVIAAYNCGPGNVNKAIRRSGGKKNYWEIYYHLPRETRGYVPAFIAATYVMNYYQDHNITPLEKTLPLAVDTILVNKTLHFEQVSNVLNIDKELLRELNPQFKKDIIPATKNSFAFVLPFEFTGKFIELEDSIFNYKSEVYTKKTVIAKVDAKASKSSNYKYDPPKIDGKTKLFYTVKSGDNLGFIADWYGINISDLKYWNDLRRNFIKAGQKLVVYVDENEKSKYEKISTLPFEEKQQTIGKTTTAAPEEIELDDNFVYYTVKSGDNLWTIAKKYPGVSDADLMKLNNISNTRRLSLGQIIKIKRKE